MPVVEFRADQRRVQTQSQTLSPALQRAVRLLQMSSLDFAAEVQDVLGRNPFLEPEEGEDVPGTTAALPRDAVSQDGLHSEEASVLDAPDSAPHEPAQEVFDRDEESHFDRDLWQAGGRSGASDPDGGQVSALDLVADQTALNVHLHGQLNLSTLAPRVLACARAIVESVDDDGYLRSPLEALLEVAALDPIATLPEMQIALQRVQALEPAGVAARTVAECLLLQLPSIACPDMRELATLIVTDHLAALASRDVAGLARRLGVTPEQAEAACDRIRRLDPRPGWRFGSSHIAYIVPDVVVRKVRGKWTAQLNPAVVPRVRLNKVYAHLFQRHCTSTHSELRAHLHEAQWTLRNVEQRFSTILDVAQAIVDRQTRFLEYGAMAMKPLGLKEIATAVGVHESTVSRVTNNKYMSTANGVFELKHFFSRVMNTANGGACSSTAIRSLIHDMIAAESPDAPLSDVDIARLLAQQGLEVARRTVTKYRQMLKLEPAERRRRLGSP